MSDPASRRQAILEFWTWWADHRDEVLRRIRGGRDAGFVGPLSDHVKAIHEDLQWELGPGEAKAHHLCVTGAGDPRLRVLAEHWRAAGPDDPDFEFHCARQRSPNGALAIEIGDVVANLEDFALEVEADDTHQVFHLTVWHPAFEELDEGARQTILFLALDQALGEDAVETWLGRLDFSESPPSTESSVSMSELWTLVERAPERWPEPMWVLGEGEDEGTGAQVIYLVCTSAKYLLEPLFDTVCVARLPYDTDESGMPVTDEEKARVDAFEDQVMAMLGDGVRSLCRSTGAGERRYWFYLRAENGPARVTLDRLAAESPRPVELRFAWDPGWRELPT